MLFYNEENFLILSLTTKRIFNCRLHTYTLLAIWLACQSLLVMSGKTNGSTRNHHQCQSCHNRQNLANSLCLERHQTKQQANGIKNKHYLPLTPANRQQAVVKMILIRQKG